MRTIQFTNIKVLIDSDDKRSIFLCIMTANNKLIASAEWDINKKIKDMHISDIVVKEKYRGKGWGSFLARIIISIAKLYKLETISLIDGSLLEGFWQRLGFKWDSRRSQCVLNLNKVK